MRVNEDEEIAEIEERIAAIEDLRSAVGTPPPHPIHAKLMRALPALSAAVNHLRRLKRAVLNKLPVKGEL
jgi:hypothetical protein